MNIQSRLLDNYIQQVRELLETETTIERILEGIRVATEKTAGDPKLLEELPKVTETVDVYLDPDHLFCISYGPYPPDKRIPPHDHGEIGWAVYGVAKGEIVHRIYRRKDDASVPGHAELEAVATVPQKAGEAVVMRVGGIHETFNQSGETAWNLVIRSRRLTDIWRGQYEVEKSQVKKVKRSRPVAP